MTPKPTVLFSEAEIRRRVGELAAEIAEAYRGEAIAVVGLMNNCLVFMADLIRGLPVETAVHAVRVTRGAAGGRAEIVYSAEVPYEGQHILLLDDIVDTGVTLSFLLDHIREHRPKSLRVCALIDKTHDRKVEVPVDWAAFSLPDPVDHFIVGYGLDYKERYRGLPFIGTIARPAPPPAGGSLNMSQES
jgi:hypoxanthine phosphoribosyltransferase